MGLSIAAAFSSLTLGMKAFSNDDDDDEEEEPEDDESESARSLLKVPKAEEGEAGASCGATGVTTGALVVVVLALIRESSTDLISAGCTSDCIAEIGGAGGGGEGGVQAGLYRSDQTLPPASEFCTCARLLTDLDIDGLLLRCIGLCQLGGTSPQHAGGDDGTSNQKGRPQSDDQACLAPRRGRGGHGG